MNWKPQTHTRICSDHFVGGRKINHPNSPSYIPTVKPGMKKILATECSKSDENPVCSRSGQVIHLLKSRYYYSVMKC